MGRVERIIGLAWDVSIQWNLKTVESAHTAQLSEPICPTKAHGLATNCIYNGACWAGPSFREVIADVSAEAAVRKHPPLAHSIWQTVAHASVWVEVVRRRIAEWTTVELADADSFPAVEDATPAVWAALLTELEERVNVLRELATGLDPAKLDAVAPGTDYPVAVMLHGTAQHITYHAGQIALLKRLR